MKKHILFIFISLLPFSQASAELSYTEIKAAYADSYHYELTEHYTDAIKALQVVHKHYPEAYTINLRLGYLHLLNGKYSNATRHYQAAVVAVEHAISPKLGLMQVALIQKAYDQAEQVGFQILKRDVNNYYGNLRLAIALIGNQKYDNAQAIVDKMLALYPEDILFLEQLAELHVIRKEYERASAVFSNILILDPENVKAKYYFSLAVN